MRAGIFARGLILIATLAAIGFAIEESGLRGALDSSWIDNRVRGHGVTGEVLFIGTGALLIAVGFPRQIVCFLGGYAFGFVGGTLMSLLASILGCVGAFSYARLLGRGLVAMRCA